MAEPCVPPDEPVLGSGTNLIIDDRLIMDDRMSVEPLREGRPSGAGHKVEFNPHMSLGVHPHDFALAFNAGTGGKVEGKFHGGARREHPESAYRHAHLAHVGGKRPMMDAAIGDVDRNNQFMAEVAFLFGL